MCAADSSPSHTRPIFSKWPESSKFAPLKGVAAESLGVAQRHLSAAAGNATAEQSYTVPQPLDFLSDKEGMCRAHPSFYSQKRGTPTRNCRGFPTVLHAFFTWAKHYGTMRWPKQP